MALRCRGWLPLAVALLLLLSTILPAHAAPGTQGPPLPGAIVGLVGSPHLWIAGDDGLLHWASDARVLAGKQLDWRNRREVTVAELNDMRRGDPWLSAGLLKMGDALYVAKWEHDWPAPRLLHIQSLADLALFGINATNYAALVLDETAWQAKFQIAPQRLERALLPPATTPPSPTAAEAGALAGALSRHDFDTFVQSALGSMTHGRITKWTAAIRIEIVRGDRMLYGPEVERVAAELQTLLGGIDVSVVPSSGNIRLSFVRSDEMRQVFPEAREDLGHLGLARLARTPGGITSCEAVIATNPYERQGAPVNIMTQARMGVLRHELGHCVGLDHNTSPMSTMGRVAVDGSPYSPLDRAILRTLYSPDLRMGMDETHVRSLFTNGIEAMCSAC